MTEVDAAPLPQIDPARAVEVIVAFIREQMVQAGFERLVIGLSGGVDSGTVAFLAARAIGAETAGGVPSAQRGRCRSVRRR